MSLDQSQQELLAEQLLALAMRSGAGFNLSAAQMLAFGEG